MLEKHGKYEEEDRQGNPGKPGARGDRARPLKPHFGIVFINQLERIRVVFINQLELELEWIIIKSLW
jgi:hypothetical protein